MKRPRSLRKSPETAEKREPALISGASRDWLLTAGLLVLVWFAYYPVIGSAFLHWDDPLTITQNPDFAPPHAGNWGHYWRAPYLQLYMPLTYMAWGGLALLSAASDEFGRPALDPMPFHCASVLLHAFNTMMLFVLLRRLTGARWPAAAGAMLFALHPLQVESVAWITSFSIVLSTAFSLLAVWQFDLFCDRVETRAGKLHFGIGTVCFVLALLAKPSAIVVPVIAGIIELLQCQRPLRRIIFPLGLWALLCVPITWIGRSAQRAEGVHVAWTHRPFVAVDALAFYLWKLVVPATLLPDYGRTPPWLFAHPSVIIVACAALSAVILVCLVTWRRYRIIAVASAISFVALLPVSGLVTFSYQHYSTVADRYAYLAMLGPALLVAVLLRPFPRNRRAIGASFVALLILGTITFRQCRFWRDTFALMQYELASHPDSPVAHRTLGLALDERIANEELRGDASAAQADLEETIKHHLSAATLPEGRGFDLYNAATAEVSLRRYDIAVQHFDRATADVRLPPAVRVRCYTGIAAAEQALGHPAASIDAAQNALKLDPNDRVAEKLMRQAKALLTPVKTAAPATQHE